MWIRKTEEDIELAVSNRSLSETVIFDAKKEIPARNVDTAIDVSALANTSGGVLLYGVGEDQTGCPCVPNPIALDGQRERIDQIVRSSVDEVPEFNIFPAIPTRADPAKGYLVVLVPPSDRAPHMVIVKGERRFYGRGETGNYVLSQAEVSRLYERRQQAAQADLALDLTAAVESSPIPPNESSSHLHLLVRPVISDDSLFAKAIRPDEKPIGVLADLIVAVRDDPAVYPVGEYSPDFNVSPYGWKRYPDAYFCRMNVASENSTYPDPDTLDLRVDLDGGAYLFCGRAADSEGGQKYFLGSVVEGNTTRLLAMVSRLYERASYYGLVDIGIRVNFPFREA